MAGKVEQRREALRKRLIDIAETQIARDGIAGIKARDLAREAGCAVGAIYNVFGDLHDIVIAVNGRTFQRLGTVVGGALQGHEGDAPTQRMIVMAHAYLDFAADDPMMWRSLFDVRMSADGPPQWYLDELDRLFGYIAGPATSKADANADPAAIAPGCR